MTRIAPLSKGFMLMSIIGFIAVVIYWNALGATWGIALGLLFLIMFISSMISMTYGPSAVETEMDNMVVVPSKKIREAEKSIRLKKKAKLRKKAAKKKAKLVKRKAKKKTARKSQKKKASKKKKPVKKKKK